MAFKRKASASKYTRNKRRKVYKRKTYRRTNLVRTIRAVALRNTETKYKERGGENINLYHNGGATPDFLQINNIIGTGQGDDVASRAGDEIFAKGIAFKIWLSNKADRPNVMYRIIVYTSPVLSAVTVADDVKELLDTSSGGGNRMLSYANTEKFKILYNKMVQPFSGDYSLEPSATNKEHSKLIKFYLNLKNRRVKYNSPNGPEPKYQRDHIHLAVIPYDAYGTLTSDNIASCAINIRFYFKDP